MKNYKVIIALALSVSFVTSSKVLLAQSETEKKNIDSESWDGFWRSIWNRFDHNYWERKSDHVENKGLTEKLNLEGKWKFAIGDNNRWISNTYNDNGWEDIRVPADWENEGYNGYDGYAWYRIHFDGKLLAKNDMHYIVLGTIDDVDETYLNGELIGKSGTFPPRFRTAYDSKREYIINNRNIDFEGDNVIAVRVYDDYKNGGLISGNLGIYTTQNNENVLQSLNGAWKFSRLNKNASTEMTHDDSDWETLFVPAYWDNQGYRSLDGTNWYRKKFRLEFEPEKNKNYYLVLGKIDDFDETYFNGFKIGETNDGLGYGISKSYNQIRVYKIPKHLLFLGEENLIAIKVIDIGVDGGIYKGPIGIVEEENIAKVLKSNNGYN